MSDFFDEITIIGFTPVGGEVRALIEKVDGVGATDLLPALDALGEGGVLWEVGSVQSLCGPSSGRRTVREGASARLGAGN